MSDFQIETRRRSRSKTPFLRSSCDHEACEHAGEEGHEHHIKKKKAAAPSVQTIIEETVEVTSSSSATPYSKLTQSKAQQKQKTSDYSSEDVSPETKTSKRSTTTSAASSSATTTTTSSSSTTIITKSKKLAGSGTATSTPKSNFLYDSFAAQFASAGTAGRRSHKEVEQNKINSEFERSQKQAAQTSAVSGKSRSFSRIFGSLTAGEGQSFRGDPSDHIAYMEYKKAGEYWKTTPKTDYTYSELSPHRRVLAPGVVAMPNMSRRSLENHHERVNYMIDRDPAREEFIRHRYETTKYQQNRRATEQLVYDSGDEVDYSQYAGYRKNRSYFNGGGAAAAQYDGSEESWFVRLLTTVVTTITSTWTTVTGGGGGGAAAGAAFDESALYRTKFGQEERGFFGSIAHGISSAFASVFRYIYLGISSILYFDTWLLQSSNPENRNKKRFLLFLLILLPLLLLAGVFYYLHPNEPFPPKHFSEYTISLPSLPALPKIDMSAYLNQEQYETIKTQTYARLDDFRTWADDYVLYLRTVSRNIADEGRKIFQREEHFERV